MKFMLGAFHQGVFLNGWIPKPLELSVSHEHYSMKFNIQTYDVEGKMRLIPCLADGEVAKQLHQIYNKFDAISVFGQLHTVYQSYNSGNRNALFVKVLSFSISASFLQNSFDAELPPEQQEMLDNVMKTAYEYIVENQKEPTKEEIEYWTKYWKDWEISHPKKGKQ